MHEYIHQTQSPYRRILHSEIGPLVEQRYRDYHMDDEDKR
jgi:hypothetical protein